VDLAWVIVHPIFDAPQLFYGQLANIRAFWNEAAKDAVAVFIAGARPRGLAPPSGDFP
jgi:hypothetical protein